MNCSVSLSVMSTSSSCSNTHRTLVVVDSSPLHRYCESAVTLLVIIVIISTFI